MKIKLSVEGNVFEIEAEAPFAEVRPLLETWLAINQQIGKLVQPQIDALVARLQRANTKLETAVETARS